MEEHLEWIDSHQIEMFHLASHQKSLPNSRSSTEERNATSSWMLSMQLDRGNKQAFIPILQVHYRALKAFS